MMLRRLSLAAAVVAAGTLHAAAQSATPPAADTQHDFQPPRRDAIACGGPFARDTTHAKLVAAFGAKNVAFKKVDEAEGPSGKATVLFDDDPTRRIVVFWHDDRRRARPSTVSVGAPSLWIGPGGVGNGMGLSEVEKLNGKPFKLSGFDGDDHGGLVRELDGRLASLAGGCSLVIRFEPGIANPLPPRYAAISGDKLIVSSNRLLRRTRAQVSEWGFSYPR